jgi:xanthine/uracil/vitamin C permease (AzgA family)
MPRSRLVAIGLGIMIAGLVTLMAGVVVASHDLLVGLILLLLVPMAVSFCGATVTLIGLVRQSAGRGRSSIFRTIIGVAACAGLGYGFGFPVLGTLSQLPDYAARLNGTYLPEGPTVLLFPAACLLVGLVTGIPAALIWQKTQGNRMPPTPADEPSPGSVAP